MRNHVIRLWLCMAFFAESVAAGSAGTPTIQLTASRMVVLADGRDTTEIIAEVRDATGSYVPDGTVVSFTTTRGMFVGGGAAQTRAGVARVRLSSQQTGTATVTAAVVGRAESMDITFTNDPSETFQGNLFAAVQGGSVVYSADYRVIEAVAKEGSSGSKRPAHATYRNFEVLADRIQIDCNLNVLRASGNAVLRRGNHRVRCGKLFLQMIGGEAYAVAEMGDRLRPVKITGPDLKMTVEPNGIAPARFEMADLADSKLLITAQQVLLFPGQKLQFKRPHFYQDGQHLVSMPFYSLALMSNELFTDQFLTVGTQGIGLDVPLYYDLTPSSTGIFYIRHGERYGSSVYATRPGWSLDLLQGYNSLGGSGRYTGQFGFTGITRSDWGFRWTHSQEFTTDARGSFYLDFPQHRSVYGSANLTKQMGPVYAGLNISGNRSFAGFPSSGYDTELYLETLSKRLGSTGYFYAVGTTTALQQVNSGPYRTRMQSQDVHARIYSNPFRLDRNTVLTSNFTVGNVWANHGGGASVVASMAASRRLPGASLQLAYDYTQGPVLLATDGHHRLSLSLITTGSGRWSTAVSGSMMLDTTSSSLMANVSYTLAPRWHLSLASSLQRFMAGQYRDYELSIGRTLGARELVFSYSTFSHRIFFDLEAGRF
ncbi:MAG: Ig-like domain-containing protein [Chthonomonadales bacterium]